MQKNEVWLILFKEINWAVSWKNLSSEESDQVRHELACSVTDYLESRNFGFTKYMYRYYISRQWTTKMLIRLRECAGWSVPLFTYGINRFSHDMVQLHFSDIYQSTCLMKGSWAKWLPPDKYYINFEQNPMHSYWQEYYIKWNSNSTLTFSPLNL